MASTPGFGFGHGVLSFAYHELGERDKAIAAAANNFRVNLNFPEGALALEKAIDWYEVGYQISGPGVPYLGVMVKSSAIRTNPRFEKLLRDLKLDFWVDKNARSRE